MLSFIYDSLLYFGKSGPALELLEIFGLNAANIAAKAKAAIALKK